jgi:uncharacterized membrane protein
MESMMEFENLLMLGFLIIVMGMLVMVYGMLKGMREGETGRGAVVIGPFRLVI